MKTGIKGLIVFALLASINVHSSKDTTVPLEQIIDGIQKFYKDLKDFRADFTQIYSPVKFSKKTKEKGRFFFSKPAKMRFQYLSPEKKEMIYYQRTFWNYDVDGEEVSVKKNVSRKQLGVAFQFLWGSGNLRKTFQIRFVKDASFGQKGDFQIELIPKTKQSLFKKLFFSVASKTFAIRETVYLDVAGNKNRFVFTNLKINTGLPERVFQFTPPKGIHVNQLP